MKKILLLMTFLTMFVCISCNNDEMLSEKHSDAYEQLHRSIIQINTKYKLSNNNQTPSDLSKKKGFWKWLGRVFSTVAADVGGSITIGSSGVSWNIKQGIDCSISVWKMWDKKEEADTIKQKPNDIKNPISININAIPSINGNQLENNSGYVHNTVIINLYNKYGEDLKKFTDKQINKAISIEYNNVIKNANLTTNYVISDSINDEIVDNICKIAEKCENVGDFISVLTLEYPQVQQELNMLKTAMEEIISGDIPNEKMDDYIFDVVDTINKSNISVKSKTILKTTIGVAGASSRLWVLQQ